MGTEKVKRRGRPKLPADSARTAKISAMVTAAEVLALKEYSALVGLSISDVIRIKVAATIANNPRQDS